MLCFNLIAGLILAAGMSAVTANEIVPDAQSNEGIILAGKIKQAFTSYGVDKSKDKSQKANEADLTKKIEDKVKEVVSKDAQSIPLDIELEYTTEGKTTLAELLKDKKAVLIDFWATWCGPCIAYMPHLKQQAQVLIPQGVGVIGMNIDSKSGAERIRKAKNIDFTWLHASKPGYQKMLNIEYVPHVALVSSEGKVLYTGHPESAELEKALSSLGVKL